VLQLIGWDDVYLISSCSANIALHYDHFGVFTRLAFVEMLEIVVADVEDFVGNVGKKLFLELLASIYFMGPLSTSVSIMHLCKVVSVMHVLSYGDPNVILCCMKHI
jgi:hypothetical protein